MSNGPVAVVDRVVFPEGESAHLLRITKTLTDTQIKALPTSNVEIVPMPGAGLVIVPVLAVVSATTSFGAYTNIDAAAFLFLSVGTVVPLSYVPNDAVITNASATNLSDFLGSATNHLVTLVPYERTEGVDVWGPIPDIVTRTDVENIALTIKIDNNGAGNLTGGNGSNSLKVTVYYLVAPI